MSVTAQEIIDLGTYPQMRRILIQLFSMADLPFTGNELTPMDLKRLFTITREKIAVTLGQVKAHDKPRHALIITDLGIMRHQLRLMAQYARLTPVCVDLSGEVAKVLEKHEFDVMILELALEWSQDGAYQPTVPTILNYLVDFRESIGSGMLLIVLLNLHDPRRAAIEAIVNQVIIKDMGWQDRLHAHLKGMGACRF